MARLTAEQIKARGELVEVFRLRLAEAVWLSIEECDQSLLCSDDGTPYGALVQESTRLSSLEQMANECVGKAISHMRNWL